MESSERVRTIQMVANVMMPDYFAVRGIEEGNTVAVKAQRVCGCSSRISFRLREDILRAKRELLCLNDAENPTSDAERVICWSVVRLVFFDCAAVVRGKRFAIVEGDDSPPAALSLGSMRVLRVSHSDSDGEKGFILVLEPRLYQPRNVIIRLT